MKPLKRSWKSKDLRFEKTIIIFVLFFLTLILGIGFGTLKLNIIEIYKAIFLESSGLNHNVIFNVRLPRNLIAAFVGMNLAVSGVTLQGVMKNPLADPGLIGITSGAGLMAFVIMIIFPDYHHLVSLGAFMGALLTAFLIYILAWKDGISPVRLILSGVAVSTFLGSGIKILMTFYPEKVAGGLNFMIGSLSGVTWPDFHLVWPYSLFGIVVLLFFSKRINLLQLGDEVAIGLGLHVEWTRRVLITIAAILAASAVSVVGLLGFVGLIVPHMARMIVGSDYKYLLPASIGLGGLVLVGCDLLSRMIFDPVELPVGIIMSLIGAPFFLYLLREKKDVY